MLGQDPLESNIELSRPAVRTRGDSVYASHAPLQAGCPRVGFNDYYDARQAGIFDSSCAPMFFVQSLSFFWYRSSSFHR